MMIEQMKSKFIDSCVFCQIAAGLKPAEILYQNALFLIFLDQYRQPSRGGHILIIPRQHYPDLLKLLTSFMAPLMQLTK